MAWNKNLVWNTSDLRCSETKSCSKCIKLYYRDTAEDVKGMSLSFAGESKAYFKLLTQFLVILWIRNSDAVPYFRHSDFRPCTSDIYMLIYMPICPPLRKQQQQQTFLSTPQINKQKTTYSLPGTNPSGSYWQFPSAGNIPFACIFLCSDCSEDQFFPYVRGQERRVIPFTLVLAPQLMLSLSLRLAFVP